jgi:hypothetical protein
MRLIQPGEVHFEGEFSYEVVLEDGKAVGYQLTAYGSEKTWGDNAQPGLEHAIIQLTSGPPDTFNGASP